MLILWLPTWRKVFRVSTVISDYKNSIQIIFQFFDLKIKGKGRREEIRGEGGQRWRQGGRETEREGTADFNLLKVHVVNDNTKKLTFYNNAIINTGHILFLYSRTVYSETE